MAIMSILLGLGHFFILLATGIYRFDSFGRLCALNEEPTHIAPGSSGPPTDKWTYAKDGILIIVLWVFQLLSFACCCLIGVWPTKIYIKPAERLHTQGDDNDAGE